MSHFHRNKTAASQNYMKNEHLVDKIYLVLKSSVKEYKTMNSPIKRTFYFWNSFIIIKEKITYRKLFIISFSFSCDGCRSFATAIGISNININMTCVKTKQKLRVIDHCKLTDGYQNIKSFFEVYRTLALERSHRKHPYVLFFFRVDRHTFQFSSTYSPSFQHLHLSTILTYFFGPPTSMYTS